MAKNEAGVTVVDAAELPPLAEEEMAASEPDLVEEPELPPPTLAEATALLADAQLRALTAEQAANTAATAVHLAQEKLANCKREIQELQEETRTADPDDSTALRKLGTARFTLEAKCTALETKVQLAEKARDESIDAVDQASGLLVDAENAQHDARVREAEDRVLARCLAFNADCAADIELVEPAPNPDIADQWSPIELAAKWFSRRDAMARQGREKREREQYMTSMKARQVEHEREWKRGRNGTSDVAVEGGLIDG